MLHIVLYRPEIAGNVGNIMRTCAAIGAELHLIGPFPFDLHSKQARRAALDYDDMLTIKTYDSYEQFLDDNKSELIYMVSRHGKQTYSDVEYPKGDIYLMFGSESSGIPLDILSVNRDKTLRIPMRPAARSLNLSNSVAIITYEVLRQRRYENLALREVLKGEDYL